MRFERELFSLAASPVRGAGEFDDDGEIDVS
jgi:hypothetical protein